MENKNNKCGSVCSCGKDAPNFSEIIKKYLEQGQDPEKISNLFLENLNSSVKQMKEEQENKELISAARDDLISSILDYTEILNLVKKEEENKIISALIDMFKSFENLVEDGKIKLSFNQKDFKDILSLFSNENRSKIFDEIASLDKIFNFF